MKTSLYKILNINQDTKNEEMLSKYLESSRDFLKYLISKNNSVVKSSTEEIYEKLKTQTTLGAIIVNKLTNSPILLIPAEEFVLEKKETNIDVYLYFLEHALEIISKKLSKFEKANNNIITEITELKESVVNEISINIEL